MSLEVDEEGEEAEPEDTHGVPVPGYGVDHDLPAFDAAEGEEADQGGDERDDSGGQRAWA